MAPGSALELDAIFLPLLSSPIAVFHGLPLACHTPMPAWVFSHLFQIAKPSVLIVDLTLLGTISSFILAGLLFLWNGSQFFDLCLGFWLKILILPSWLCRVLMSRLYCILPVSCGGWLLCIFLGIWVCAIDCAFVAFCCLVSSCVLSCSVALQLSSYNLCLLVWHVGLLQGPVFFHLQCLLDCLPFWPCGLLAGIALLWSWFTVFFFWQTGGGRLAFLIVDLSVLSLQIGLHCISMLLLSFPSLILSLVLI